LNRWNRSIKTEIENLKIFFGPSVKVCCFKVSDDFVKHIEGYSFAKSVLRRRSDDLYFDLPGFNRFLLRSIGVKEGSINLDYNMCTMCDENFFSFRRQKDKAGRQMTVVSLR